MPLNPDEVAAKVAHFGGIRPTVRAMSNHEGWSFGSIHKALQRSKQAKGETLATVHVEDEVVNKAEEEQFKLKEEVRILRGQLNDVRREELDARKIREAIYELSDSPITPPPWTQLATAPGTPGVPITIWSDWHWAEMVDKLQMNGLNEFNSKIASERVLGQKGLVSTIIDLSIDHMVNPQYPGIVVNLGGDMISGMIHEELRDTNDQYLLPACLDVQDHIAAGLERLADKFGKVFVPCVPGNHGRSSIKPRMKGRVYTSYEWSIYCQLERYFRNDPRFQFMVPPSADAHYNVYDHRFMLTHGDSLGVQGGDGIIGAIGPISRGAVKVGRSEAQVGKDFDTILMGHWHQMLFLPGIIVNGALKGYDEYARLQLRVRFERATQALWFVHPKHGITAQWPVYLQKQPSTPAPWISWPGEEGK